MEKRQNLTEDIGTNKKLRTEAFVRLLHAMKECRELDNYYSIREIQEAYCKLRQAALVFGEEMGWDRTDALQKAANEKERQNILLVQKLSRIGQG